MKCGHWNGKARPAKRFALLALAFLLTGLLLAIPKPALAYSSGDWGYVVFPGGENCEIYHYSGSGGTVDVPAKLDGYTVTSIGDNAFIKCGTLEELTIPGTVTHIGEFAFQDCAALRKVRIRGYVTEIGRYAFSRCGITSVDLPGTLSVLGEGVFWACPYLETVTMEEGVTVIGRSCFLNCASLKSIEIPESVAEIGESAFGGCASLEDVYVGNAFFVASSFADTPCRVSVNCTNRSMADLGERLVRVHEPVTDARVRATCTQTGLTEGSHCERCGETLTAQETVPALGHDTVTVPGTPATCTEDGLTEGSCCARCGEVLAAQQRIPAPGHTPVTDPAVPATCKQDGLTEGSHCSVCGEFLVRQAVVPAAGHKPVLDPAVEPTDTQPGYTEGSHCSVCGAILAPQREISPRTWSVEPAEGGCAILRYYGSAEMVTVPETIEGKTVTAIREGAFTGDAALQRILIPDTVRNLDEELFAGRPAIYCREFSEADIWAFEYGYETVYTDDPENGDFYVIELPEDFRIQYGERRDLGAVIFPVVSGTIIRWTSGDESVARVENGRIEAVAPGRAEITVKAGSVTRSAFVTVYGPALNFAVTPTELYAVQKSRVSFEITDVVPAGADVRFSWQSSNEEIAKVSQEGEVTALRLGDAVVTVVSDNGIRRECLVHVCEPVTALAFDEREYEVRSGRRIRLGLEVSMGAQRCRNQLVTFESSDETIAAVDAHGVVTGVAPGIVEVTARAANGVTAVCAVAVD